MIFTDDMLQIERLKVYIFLLQSKLASHPELEPSLVETSIGEDEEGIRGVKPHPGMLSPGKKPTFQRSLSDRYSYRAAIFQDDHVELDVL